MPTCATLTDIHDLINTGMCVNAYSAVASSIIGGGLIYTRVLKSIVFMVCEHEYMNMSPPPPIIEVAMALAYSLIIRIFLVHDQIKLLLTNIALKYSNS